MTNNRNAHCLGDEYRADRAVGPAHHRCAPAERAGHLEAGGRRRRGHGVDGGAAWAAVARPGIVVVTGVLDHLRCGLGISLQVRLRCRPGTANAVAEALAALDVDPLRHRRHRQRRRRGGVRRAGTTATSRRCWSTELPRPDDIVETEAMVVVRKFSAVGGVGHRPARPGRGRAAAPRRRRASGTRLARDRAAHRAGVRDRPGARRRRPGVLRADRGGRRGQRLDGGAPGGVARPPRVPALPHRSSTRR